MTRKYHNHVLHNNLQFREEEAQDTYKNKTVGRQFKYSNQLFLPQWDDDKSPKEISTA